MPKQPAASPPSKPRAGKAEQPARRWEADEDAAASQHAVPGPLTSGGDDDGDEDDDDADEEE